MSKRKNKQQEPHYVFDKKRNRKLQVSKPVYDLIIRAQTDGQEIKTITEKKIEEIGLKLSKKAYMGETKDLKILVSFTKEGLINDMASPKVEVKNSALSPEDAVYQFMLCEQQAITKRNNEMKAMMEQSSKEVAKKLEEAA